MPPRPYSSLAVRTTARMTAFSPGQSPPPLQTPIVRMLLIIRCRAPVATEDFTPTILRAPERVRAKGSIERQERVPPPFCYNAGRFEHDGGLFCRERMGCRLWKN